MPEKPTLFVCHGDDGGPSKKLPTLKLPDGTVISNSRAILAWVREQPQRADTLERVA